MTKAKRKGVAVSLDGQRLAQALSSVISTEFEATIETCRSGDDAGERVHSARKHLKRWRALVRLLPRAAEKKLSRPSRVVRLVARRLGGVRDAVAQLETWRKFNEAQANQEPEQSPSDPIAERLEQSAQMQLGRGVVEQRLQRGARALQLARAEVQLALAAGIQSEQRSLRAVARGLRRSYRKARLALSGARLDPNGQTLHTLRRANKAHQYQLQFLEPAWQKLLKAQRLEAAELSDELGEHHDLTLIAAAFPGSSDSPSSFDPTLAQLTHWQRGLEQKALRRAALVYSEKPRAFRRRVLGYLRVDVAAPSNSETQ
ncbi:MAG TPA: CHAD domain-containing protein [Polyangiaceae bacterium]|nr:CHAD domain-containing protein [Polyangiaceae bacterium]